MKLVITLAALTILFGCASAGTKSGSREIASGGRCGGICTSRNPHVDPAYLQQLATYDSVDCAGAAASAYSGVYWKQTRPVHQAYCASRNPHEDPAYLQKLATYDSVDCAGAAASAYSNVYWVDETVCE